MSKAKSASRCERRFAAGRLFDDEAVIGEALSDRLAQRVLVVDDQQMFLAVRHLGADGILTPRVRAVNARPSTAAARGYSGVRARPITVLNLGQRQPTPPVVIGPGDETR